MLATGRFKEHHLNNSSPQYALSLYLVKVSLKATLSLACNKDKDIGTSLELQLRL